MKQNFCTHTTRKIRKLGYPQRVAAIYAGFLCTGMVLVCAVMDVLRVPSQEDFNGTANLGRSHAATRALSFHAADGALRR